MVKKSLLSTAAKEALVRRMESGERVSDLSKEADVLRKSLYEWRAAYRAFGAAGLNRKRGRKVGWNRAARPADELAEAQARIAELERLVGRQQADLHFFREALRLFSDHFFDDRVEAGAMSFGIVASQIRKASRKKCRSVC